MLFKYIIKNTAWEQGKTVTFMPKPVFGDNGSGMHAHQSLWADGKPLFYDEAGYGGLSDMARYYIGGLLHHAPSLLAFTNPTINSYHRLVPGYEAPVNLVYSARNRSACIRIPLTGTNAKAKRLEFRCPDPSANPYLAFAAMMMAGLDGIKNKIEPPAPVDKDLYELPPDEAANIPQVPGSLAAVIDRLEQDHDYLLEGGVFTPDLIEMWIQLKREEIDAHPAASAPVRVRPVLRHLILGSTRSRWLRRLTCGTSSDVVRCQPPLSLPARRQSRCARRSPICHDSGKLAAGSTAQHWCAPAAGFGDSRWGRERSDCRSGRKAEECPPWACR